MSAEEDEDEEILDLAPQLVPEPREEEGKQEAKEGKEGRRVTLDPIQKRRLSALANTPVSAKQETAVLAAACAEFN